MASVQVNVSSQVLSWAVTRSQKDAKLIQSTFPKYTKWLSGELKPTYSELKKFAKAVYLPAPILLLKEPLKEILPIKDFRRKSDSTRPSPNLMDTIQTCKRRQEWYRQFVILSGGRKVDYVGSLTVRDNPIEAAQKITKFLRNEVPLYKNLPKNSDGIKEVIETFESTGCLVIRNGVVGNNTHRPLDVEEFRGFSISDIYAPLIFINGTDAKSAQVFSLFHEFAHLWLGESGISNSEYGASQEKRNELWCNEVAAEVLVPSDDLREHFDSRVELSKSIAKLHFRYKVSREVILRKLDSLRMVSKGSFDKTLMELQIEYAEARTHKKNSGGDFYLNQPYRLSRAFALAVDHALTLDQILPTDALEMLSFKSFDVYDKALEKLKL